MLLLVCWLLLCNESIMYWHICYATICIYYHIREYYEVVICNFIVRTYIILLYIHIPSSTHFFIWYTSMRNNINTEVIKIMIMKVPI